MRYGKVIVYNLLIEGTFMEKINTDYLEKCLKTLEKSYAMIQKAEDDSIEYEMFRNSLVKGFEITLEQSGKLLKKILLPYVSSKKALDALTFKDIFREAHKHSLLTEEEVSRWFTYRDNRNNTTHDYGEFFAEETLDLIEDFINDVYTLQRVIKNA